MTTFITPVNLLIFCVVLLICLALLFIYVSGVNRRLTTTINLINDLYRLSQQQAQAIADINDSAQDNMQQEAKQISPSQTIELNKKIADLESNFVKVENQLMQLQSNDPELKMYKKANELLERGASAQDIIDSCDLPRAEVEVLIGMHSKKKKS